MIVQMILIDLCMYAFPNTSYRSQFYLVQVKNDGQDIALFLHIVYI